jgi:hypothetical protein
MRGSSSGASELAAIPGWVGPVWTRPSRWGKTAKATNSGDRSSGRLGITVRLVAIDGRGGDASPEVRLRRGLQRDGAEARGGWERWGREEDAHFAADRARDRPGVIVDRVWVPSRSEPNVATRIPSWGRARRTSSMTGYGTAKARPTSQESTIQRIWGQSCHRCSCTRLRRHRPAEESATRSQVRFGPARRARPPAEPYVGRHRVMSNLDFDTIAGPSTSMPSSMSLGSRGLKSGTGAGCGRGPDRAGLGTGGPGVADDGRLSSSVCGHEIAQAKVAI